jgi:hypothetical protein
MAQESIEMVKMLVQDVEVVICVNGCITKTFTIERGVRWGCPLAPPPVHPCRGGPQLHVEKG